MTTILFDLGGAANHDNENALPLVNSSIASGSVIDTTGAVVPGVAITTPNPFGAQAATSDQPADTQVTQTTRMTNFSLTSSDTAQHVITGLPNGVWDVEVYGQRLLSEVRQGTVQFNGGAVLTFDADGRGTFATRTAEDTITISDGTLTINYAKGTGSFAHFTRLKLYQQPGPSITNVDTDDIISQGQQDIVINVANLPTGNVPIRAGAGGTNGVGGTDFTGLVVTPGAAGAFTITCDVPIGIAISSSTECYVEHAPE